MIGVAVRQDASKALRALDGLSSAMRGYAVSGIVREIATGTFKQAFENLSGDRTAPKGSWPVPVRIGHLRRSLWALLPGGEKAGGGISGKYGVGFSEAYVGDSAEYAEKIHEERPFLYAALDDQMSKAPGIARAFMDKEVRLRGLD